MSLQEIASSPISEAQRREPVCITPETPLLSVVEKMCEHRRGAVAVVNELGVLVGIFSISDLTMRVDHSNHDWHKTPVSAVMTEKPICIREDETLAVALRLMEQGAFRHLPRVDSEGRPTAILSVRDILAYVSEHFPKEFLNLPPDPAHEAKTPWGG